MPLPISSRTFIPNPLTGVQAEQAGFAQGKQTSDFANIAQGAFQGIEFSQGIKDRESVRDAREAQVQQGQQQQQLREEQFEFNQGVAQQQLGQKDRQLDLQEQRQADLRADRLATQSRLSANAAIDKKNSIRDAEYNVAMNQLIAHGNPDAFIGLVSDSGKLGGVLSRAAKDDPAFRQEAVKSLEDAITSGRIRPEQLPQAQAALRTLSASPEVSSSAEQRERSAEAIHRETGFRAENNTSRLRLRDMTRAERRSGDMEGSNAVIEEIREDGSVRTWPYKQIDDRGAADLQRSINAYNQQVMRAEEVRQAIAQATRTKPVLQQLEQASQQSQPVQAGRQRRQLGQLASSESSTAVAPEQARDSLRLKIQERLRTSGR